MQDDENLRMDKPKILRVFIVVHAQVHTEVQKENDKATQEKDQSMAIGNRDNGHGTVQHGHGQGSMDSIMTGCIGMRQVYQSRMGMAGQMLPIGLVLLF